ncbi:BTAD domain-containing putative transcriptional regulator [Kribbella sp. NPDC003505]|uniref:AfsR/SARP family transcriptional regulator n=1 Tax=Kribbella sp. NPDC003505 TaxID=3154448 RepID=UPI0033B2F9FA
MAEIEIRLLGPFEVLVDGRPVELRTQRHRAVLVGLALHPGEVVAVDDLAALVWADSGSLPEARTVESCVQGLRAVVGQELIRAVDAGYVLEIERDQVDALRFARQAELRSDDRSEVAEILSLWRGDPLTGVGSSELLAAVAPPLVEARLAMIERLTDLDIAAERHRDGLVELEELAAAHPLRESLWARLIVALARCGRRADALDRYDLFNRRVTDELGVGPGPQLRLIHSELVRAGGPGVLSDGFDGPMPTSLPSCDPRFVGRVDEVTRLDTALDEGAGTILIHGPGGAGKTTLAIHWAHRVKDRFPEGQVYLDLEQYGAGHRTSVGEAAEILLGAFGLERGHLPASVDTRVALLRSTLTARRILLVLDNVADADQVRAFLSQGAGLVVVISREPLRAIVDLGSSASLHLGCLSFGDSLSLLAQADSPVSYSAGVMAELADLCDRVPLALAVVAGLTDSGDGRHLVAELRGEQTTSDVIGTEQDASASVRAALASSYRTLDDETGRLFRLLSLHPGVPFGLPAAAVIADLPVHEAARLTSRLVRTRLLRELSPGRFDFHDVVRRFAIERAVLSESPLRRTAAVRRVLTWYVFSADAARRKISVPTVGAVPITPAADTSPLTFDNRNQVSKWFEVEYATLVAVALESVAVGYHGLACALVECLHVYLCERDPQAAGAFGRSYTASKTVGTVDDVAVALGNLAAVEQLRRTDKPTAG